MGRKPNQSTRGGSKGGNTSKGSSNASQSGSKSSSTKHKSKTYEEMSFEIGGHGKAADVNKLMKMIINKIKLDPELGLDMATAIEHESYDSVVPVKPIMSESRIVTPAVITDGKVTTPAVREPTKADELDCGHANERYHNKLEQMRVGKAAAAAMLWQKCGPTMRTKLEARPNYHAEIKNDAVELKAIHKTSHCGLR